MSADNYFLIRRVGTRYALSMEFESARVDLDESTGEFDRALAEMGATSPIDAPGITWFDDLDAARVAAAEEYSEYGTSEDVERDAVGDTWAGRLSRLARLAETAGFDTRGWSHEDGALTMILDNGLRVRVEGAREALDQWLAWQEFVAPSAIVRFGPQQG